VGQFKAVLKTPWHRFFFSIEGSGKRHGVQSEQTSTATSTAFGLRLPKVLSS
jgi:hypothetical protein